MINRFLSLLVLSIIPVLTNCHKCLELEVKSNDYFKGTINGELPDGTKVDTTILLTTTIAGLDRRMEINSEDGTYIIYSFQITSSEDFTENICIAQMHVKHTNESPFVQYMSIFFPINKIDNLCLTQFEQTIESEFRYDPDDYYLYGKISTIMYSLNDKNKTTPFNVDADFKIKMWEIVDYD